MGRRFDPEMIHELSRKISGLQDSFTQASSDMGDGDPGDAFGNLKNASSAGETMKGFHSHMNEHFSAGAKLVDAAGAALAAAARDMQENEGNWSHTFGGGNPHGAN